jgi:uncharacterized membrane protein (UPF0127 family)
MLFPIDVIYLDAEFRVIHLIENLKPFRIAPFRLKAASILELPARSIYGSGTELGDVLMVRPPEELFGIWQAKPSPRAVWTEENAI